MKRAVRAIFRLAAAGLLLFGSLIFGLEFMGHRLHGDDISLWHCLFAAGLIVAGIILIAFSAKLAEKLTADFDE